MTTNREIFGELERVPTTGILTFHRCINYGSYWQTRSLLDAINGLGYSPQVLDHGSKEVDRAEWRVALSPTLPVFSSASDRRLYKQKVRRFQEDFERLPLSKSFSLEMPWEAPEIDNLIIGSDEVWNLQHPWYSAKPVFFGQGIRAGQKIAYAASFGNYSCWEGLGSPWTDWIDELDRVSVRDENSWWMLKNNIGIEAEIVLDPCLLNPPLARNEWIKNVDPFLLVYGHNFSPAFAEQVRTVSQRIQCRVLSLGYRNDWADDQWLDAGPEDFLSVMSRCSAVVTNFFHGCIFSFIHSKPLACEISPYRSIKVRGLMELLSGENHLVFSDSVSRLNNLLMEPPSDDIAKKIGSLRKSSLEFLRNALEVPCIGVS